MMGKKVSMKDIADKVGVSTALVSYVLNGLEKEKRIKPEIVEKVKKTIKEMNYKPNQIARSLRKGSTNTIGLIVADIANPFFGQLARIIEDEANRYNFTVIFGSSDEDHSKLKSLVNSLIYRQVDGFIIIPSEGCNEQIRFLIQQEIPVVLLDRYLPEIPTNFVVIDNYMATYKSVNCFISKGYNKIALFAYKSNMIHMRERIRGYTEAMKYNNLEKEIIIKEITHNNVRHEVEKAIENIIKQKDANALIFATNTLTLSGLYALKNFNINIPKEMAIIGFDGHEVYDFIDPPLTYIQQPLQEMGKESVKILIEEIKGSKKTVHVELKHQLIERSSC
jgi:LacI family transcriptional regulator